MSWAGLRQRRFEELPHEYVHVIATKASFRYAPKVDLHTGG